MCHIAWLISVLAKEMLSEVQIDLSLLPLSLTAHPAASMVAAMTKAAKIF